MARIPKGLNQEELLSAALEGLELQKKRIEVQIAEIRGLLGKRSRRTPAADVVSGDANPAAEGRRLSPEARERIAAAQKKRWREYRRKKRAARQA